MSGGRRERYYPLGPVLRFSGGTQGALAETMGLNRHTVNRYGRCGVPESQADRIAVELGVHPSAIWGDLWWQV